MSIARRGVPAIAGVLIPLALAACNTPKVRASVAMVEANPIQRIAVFGEAQVVWPRSGFGAQAKAPYFGICESRQALEHQMPLVRQALEAKGYDVLLCEPAGVGYCAPSLSQRLVLEIVEEDGVEQDNSDQHSLWANQEPLHLYPGVEKDASLSASLRRIFEDLEAAIAAGPGKATYTPNSADVASIGAATNADTICLVRVGGQVYSSGRKVGTALLAAALGAGGGVQDFAIISCWLIDARTGEVHWAAARGNQVRPNKASPSFVKDALKLLPERGKNLEAKHRLDS